MSHKITLQFFANLIGSWAERERAKRLKKCLLNLQAAILGMDNLDKPLGTIVDGFNDYGQGPCCGGCNVQVTRSVKKGSAAKKKK